MKNKTAELLAAELVEQKHEYENRLVILQEKYEDELYHVRSFYTDQINKLWILSVVIALGFSLIRYFYA